MRLRELIFESSFPGLNTAQASDLIKSIFGPGSQTFQMTSAGGSNPKFSCIVVDKDRTTFRVKGQLYPATSLPSQSSVSLIKNADIRQHFSNSIARVKFKVTSYAEYNDISRVEGVYPAATGPVTIVFEISGDPVKSVEKSKPAKQSQEKDKATAVIDKLKTAGRVAKRIVVDPAVAVYRAMDGLK